MSCKKFVFVFVNIVYCCILYLRGTDAIEAPGLYDATDNVIILDDGNFDANVIRASSAWNVEFYNSWCGHCKIFAPTWKKMATDLKGWRPVISLGAVDCANTKNTKLCRKYDINAFPSFKLFPPYASLEDKGELCQDQSDEVLLNKMVDFVSNTSGPDGDLPPSWPRLQPISSMEGIWDEVKDDHHHVAFVFEEPGSYIGRQVILDTFRYKRLLVRRMLKQSVTKFGITVFPSLYRINKDASFTRLATENSSRCGMVASLKGLMTPEQLEETVAIQTGDQLHVVMGQAGEDREPANIKQEVRPGVYMRDLESTLHYCLRQEVAIHRELTGDKLTALKHFVTLLAKYFPGHSFVVSFLEHLSSWLKDVGSELTGDHWVNAVDHDLQEMDAYLPDRIQWVGCEGSQAHFRGYPCGMWTLFHVLTVSAYQKQRENPKDLPMEVLPAIKGYMGNFFGCKTCVKHFLKMADTITPSDLDPRRAILWLWRAHNKANARLHGDKTEDPEHPKVQFPSKDLCPICYEGDELVEDKVFEFLLDFYGADAIIHLHDGKETEQGLKYVVMDKLDTSKLDWWERQQRNKDLEKIRDLRRKKMDRNKQRHQEKHDALAVRGDSFQVREERSRKVGKRVVVQGWGFTNLDIGMCVLFYLICTLIILVLYYHFIVRRKVKPCRLC